DFRKKSGIQFLDEGLGRFDHDRPGFRRKYRALGLVSASGGYFRGYDVALEFAIYEGYRVNRAVCRGIAHANGIGAENFAGHAEENALTYAHTLHFKGTVTGD